MHFYRFSGRDPQSDSGYWEAIVGAATAAQARAQAKRLLQESGRPDLLHGNPLRGERLARNGVIHHTVESRGTPPTPTKGRK